MKTLTLLFFLAIPGFCQALPPAVIVSSPSVPPDGLSVGQPLEISMDLLITGFLPVPATIKAVAQLPDGPVVLWQASVLCLGTIPRMFPCLNTAPLARSTPLTGMGRGLPSVPAGTQVDVVINVSPSRGTTRTSYEFSARPFVRGIEQSADRSAITIFGTFDPSTPTLLYFGLGPQPVHPDAVTVLSDRIVINLPADRSAAQMLPGLYPVTVAHGSSCDTVMFRYQAFKTGMP